MNLSIRLWCTQLTSYLHQPPLRRMSHYRSRSFGGFTWSNPPRDSCTFSLLSFAMLLYQSFVSPSCRDEADVRLNASVFLFVFPFCSKGPGFPLSPAPLANPCLGLRRRNGAGRHSPPKPGEHYIWATCGRHCRFSPQTCMGPVTRDDA